jgi:hypothetical protein
VFITAIVDSTEQVDSVPLVSDSTYTLLFALTE